jgi:methylmalonyl-CoA mutase
VREALHAAAAKTAVPTLGVTGTGGAGKSSLTDEIVRRFRLDQQDKLRIAIISIDPSRRKSGGALLGDRIRMNAIEHPNIYMRSLATREAGSEISKALPDAIAACKVAGFDLVIVETSGIGQGDAAIAPLVDVSLYVMTPEFGAASQLEKIDMLDLPTSLRSTSTTAKGAGRCATCASSISAIASCSRRRRTRCLCSELSPRASTTTASPRSTRRSSPRSKQRA